ncbi:hypothetical protein F4561_004444 [Lipingzhangella halophila]|uniref:Colicin immunity protein/pyocin immunity protein n=1 Tax=Lipingzhangella halophila TaxID=1783352 RepID=A0A7W7RKG1_9ACTN|nr:hypothetical protein [Lipingzhangella halophila]MBB4933624.1 hypothetical protein [Lipingzhangella halophila]
MKKLDRPEIIRLIETIRENDRLESDIESDEEIEKLETGIPCPHITDLIYFPDEFVADRGFLTAEEIADLAMEYKPFEL